jgi:hypothetical protein
MIIICVLYHLCSGVLIIKEHVDIICASGSVVEHLLAKEGVAGSIPVSRSRYFISTL